MEFFAITLTGFLSFMALHYTLGMVPPVTEPLRSIIAAIYAILLVVIAGALQLVDMIN